jgi:peptidyl-prolyl cis-trans isomerase SurA
MTEPQFEEAVKQQGISMAQYRDRIREEIQKSMLVNREIRGRVTVSNEEVARYYDAHKSEYATAEGMTVRDIFFRVPSGDPAVVAEVQAKAEAVHKELVDGGNWDKLADQYTDGPGKTQGGLLGTFKKGELAPELERAVARLKPGQISEVIRSGAGFHIVKVDAVESGGYRPLADVQDEIRNQLYGQDLQKRFEDWLSKDLRDRHDVQIYDQ